MFNKAILLNKIWHIFWILESKFGVLCHLDISCSVFRDCFLVSTFLKVLWIIVQGERKEQGQWGFHGKGDSFNWNSSGFWWTILNGCMYIQSHGRNAFGFDGYWKAALLQKNFCAPFSLRLWYLEKIFWSWLCSPYKGHIDIINGVISFFAYVKFSCQKIEPVKSSV